MPGVNTWEIRCRCSAIAAKAVRDRVDVNDDDKEPTVTFVDDWREWFSHAEVQERKKGDFIPAKATLYRIDGTKTTPDFGPSRQPARSCKTACTPSTQRFRCPLDPGIVRGLLQPTRPEQTARCEPSKWSRNKMSKSLVQLDQRCRYNRVDQR